MTGSDFSEITKKTPEKSLTEALKKNAGRNNQGRITTRHRGGGNKRRYRIIDFKRNSQDGVPAVVKAIEYDPNRSANIALLYYANGVKAYILAPEGLTVGATVTEGRTPRSESATACRSPAFRSVLWSTTLSFIRAAAARWSELPATAPS